MAFLASCSRSSAKGLGLAPGVEEDCIEDCGLVVAECGAEVAVEAVGAASCSRSSAKGLGLVSGAGAGCGEVTGAMEVVEVILVGVAKLFEIRATVSLASRKLPVTLKSWLTSWSDFGV